MVAAFKGSGEAWSIWCWGGGVYIGLWWGANLDTVRKVATRQLEEGRDKDSPVAAVDPPSVAANKLEHVKSDGSMLCNSGRVAPEIEP